ncbi:hypothetical protein Pcinc_035961 [Petrolisthes cinctipes]|uniref:PX domain-containing protein n=1 Tax=Petrolisthes cinctipes TaxID=88211 RepID=A0AAE1EMT2_PETCI|nr:hypothetical protein Pcinc_035961 [Petrolisthes cinctipes]
MLEEGSGSSGASSPEPEEPFTPKFKVSLSDHVNKDGESVKFTLQVSQNGRTVGMVEREFEDFEYLDHCVSTGPGVLGLIVPPVPLRSATDPYNAEIQSRKVMGKESKTLIPDEFNKDCRQLQKYLELLLSHPVLGKNQRLHDFLTEKEPPPRTKVKRGLMGRLSDTLEARKQRWPDSEEFFQQERDWVARYQPALTNAASALASVTAAHLRVGHQLEGVVTALKLSSCPNQHLHQKQFNNMNTIFLECLDGVKGVEDEEGYEGERVLGSVLGLWQRYVTGEAAMLLHRTCLMVDYQACNRALDKAKPNRKEAVSVEV